MRQPSKKSLRARIAALEAGERLLAASLQQRADTEQALLVLLNMRADQLAGRLDAVERRLERLSRKLELPPEEYTLVEAYQVVVHDICDLKRAVSALMRRAAGETIAPDDPDIHQPARH